MSDNCIFCRIAKGEIPAAVVASNDRCVAFRDLAPKAPVHCLVIPRKHVASLNGASDSALLGDLLTMAAHVAAQEKVAESGYRVVINTNGDGGQTVFHLHLHVLGGRPMEWPPG
jgi:histidine triad (HIT) family protein